MNYYSIGWKDNMSGHSESYRAATTSDRGTITVRLLRGKWTAAKTRDGEYLRAIIGRASFSQSEHEQVLRAVSEFGFDLEAI